MAESSNGHAVADRALAIVHSIPGRLRLRLPAGARRAWIAERITELPGVLGCTWSARTSSLLVRYEPGTIAPTDVVEAVAQQAGVAVAETADVIVSTHPESGSRSLGAAVTGAFADANRRVARLTGGAIDLGGLVPTLLVFWALLELFRGRTGPLAWSTALWYAHGLFRDYNVPPIRE